MTKTGETTQVRASAATEAGSVRERPILFSSSIVRAILDGRKTATRRIVKPQPAPHQEMRLAADAPGRNDADWFLVHHDELNTWSPVRCPYGSPGDRLWVREAWRSWTRTCEDDDDAYLDEDHECYEHCNQTYVAYRATPRTGYRPVPDRAAITYLDESSPIESNRELLGPWKPGIHMPRAFSRITLEVTGVRVERLQDITGRDVLAEGVDNGKSNPAQGERWENMQRIAFETLWDSINGKRAPWASNPWLWCISFRRVEAP